MRWVAAAALLVASSTDALLRAPLLTRTRVQPRAVIHSAVEPSIAQTVKAPRRQTGKLNIRIDDEWYDLTNWRVAHPAGSHWIDAYNNSDATEVMYGFHSDRALSMFKRLPKSQAPPVGVRPPVASTYAFRQFRQRLVEDGWYKPHAWGEIKKLAPWAACVGAGVALARGVQSPLRSLASVVLIAVANSLAGWLSHDYVHGRNWFCTAMRGYGELVGGMSTTWWSMKHNMHHALTNEVGYDEDIALDPALHLWRPDPSRDIPWLRKWQHFFWPLPYSILFLYWRFDSIRYFLKHKKWNEAARLAGHWAVFGALVPFKTLFFSIWLSGLITATIVTVTHQSEEIFLQDTLRKYDFVEVQFRSTRNAKCNNPISHILWGGMQWQLEHHLFPTMPRYKYRAVSEELQKFAASNDLDYRISGEFEIIGENVATLKRLAEAPQSVGAPGSEPIFKQV